MRMCVFEDAGCPGLEPLSLTRPVFDLRCGAATLLERQARRFAVTDVEALVRPFLVELCRFTHPGMEVNDGGWKQGGAVLMAYEYAPPNRRGLYASLPQIGLSIGLCLASGVVAAISKLLPESAFLSWGWRLAFAMSLALVVIGLYIRVKVMETPEFLALKRTRRDVKIPFIDMITRYRRSVLLGMGARWIDGVFFNIFAVFMIGYLTQHLAMSRTEALTGVMMAAIVMLIMVQTIQSTIAPT